MTEWYIALPVTLLILVASAFFVIIEFSLLSARRHRLEEDAETSSASRAALRSMNELTVMLAGAQLGITVATFALGAITKPWIHQLMMPLFELLPIGQGFADVISFIVSLFLVTFLHLVVGEMAPKSWAIAHPESALRLIAVPARWFVAVFRPLLLWINNMANALVSAVGEQPVERAAAKGYDAETLGLLVEHSRETGTLDASSAENIQGVIALESSTVAEVAEKLGSTPAPLLHDATVADAQARARKRGYLRVMIEAAEGPTPMVVHVRDTLLSEPESPALDLARPALMLDAETSIPAALDQMREQNEQLFLVRGDAPYSVVTWDDIMGRLWPEIEKELERAR